MLDANTILDLSPKDAINTRELYEIEAVSSKDHQHRRELAQRLMLIRYRLTALGYFSYNRPAGEETRRRYEVRPFRKFSASQIASLLNAQGLDEEQMCAIFEELVRRNTEAPLTMAKKLRTRLLRFRRNRFEQWPTFNWPTTVAALGGGDLKVDAEKHGVLSAMGYSVGIRGESQANRRAILDTVFLRPIPHSVNVIVDKAEEWGEPKSVERLKKMANAIAAFARNRKRKDKKSKGAGVSLAVHHWEADLAYLKKRYYDPYFTFRWPTT